MGNREVNLTKRVQTPHGWRYCRVLLSANGRVKPDVVVVNGKEERRSEGAYYLEWREGTKRVRLSVGKDAADASARRLRKEAELNAVNSGVAVVLENGQNGQRSLAAAISEYLEGTSLTRKPKTLAAYTTSWTYFTESCPKLFLEEIQREAEENNLATIVGTKTPGRPLKRERIQGWPRIHSWPPCCRLPNVTRTDAGEQRHCP